MKYKNDNGVAGLNILLSVIVLLFTIGLIVMIFTLMGSGLRDATYTSTTTSKTNETVTFGATNTPQSLASATLRNVVCSTTPTSVYNFTTQVQLGVTNVTLTSGCTLLNATALADFIGNGTVKVTYTYTFDDDNTATNVMNDTYNAVGGVTDWFDIFIVISAMVVLILLVVIIVTAIRGSGLVGDVGSRGANTVGTA